VLGSYGVGRRILRRVNELLFQDGDLGRELKGQRTTMRQAVEAP
jgi:hypothetical protein